MVMGKLTKEELETITSQVKVENQLASRLGAVVFQLDQLRDSKKEIITNMTQLLEERQSKLDVLRDKYSIDTLNLDNGEYTVKK
tara:strand:+ start:3908 stop:4159 length:252 start_codon:yes stop_codon:yes gene_type:complete